MAHLIGSVVWIVAASAWASACSMGPDPDEPSLVRTVLDPPPSEYAAWWRELEGCSGLNGDFWRLTFLQVVEPVLIDGREFPCGDGYFCNGMWESPHDISIAPRYVNDERLVKHEMLHDLVRTPGHPAVFEACDVTWDSGYESAPRHLPF